MSCSACGSGSGISGPAFVRDFSALSVRTNRVRGGTGQYHAVDSVLLKKRPPLGWRVYAKVGEMTHEIQAENAQAVVAGIVQLYEANGIVVTPLAAWYGANLDWLAQVQPTYAYVSVSDLEAVGVGRTAEPITAEEFYPPQVWGAKGWGFLQVLLSAESAYSDEKFVFVAKVLLDLLKDPFTGCEECAGDFEKALAEFCEEERDRSFARKWVSDYMNKCRQDQGRDFFPWDHAVKVNRWRETK